MENIIFELCQFGFIGSLLYIVYIITNFIFKLDGRTKMGVDTKFQPTFFEKIALWLSIVYMLTYLI